MKKIILLASFSLFLVISRAQSGLQFNQALFLPVSLTGSAGAVNLGTVPPGKTWKLEQVFCGSTVQLGDYFFRFNGGTSNFYIPSSDGGNFYMSNNSAWWPAGTVIAVYAGATGSPNTLYFSILEFNVVQ